MLKDLYVISKSKTMKNNMRQNFILNSLNRGFVLCGLFSEITFYWPGDADSFVISGKFQNGVRSSLDRDCTVQSVMEANDQDRT